MKHLTIIEAMESKSLFYPWFKRRFGGFLGDSWAIWKVFLAAAFGLPLTAKQMEIFTKFTGRTKTPADGFRELWAICGRGSGKSKIAALVTVFCACFIDHPNLTSGESALAICMASDKSQAKVVLKYVFDFFDRIPLLAEMEASRTQESIILKNGIEIRVMVNDYRAVRGRSLICVTADEISFWQSDENKASPDLEVLNACRPGLARVRESKLFGISSPYGTSGVVFKAYQAHYGNDESKVLFWMASTKDMNPTHPQDVIDEDMESDPERASAEWGYSFRENLTGFLTRAVVEAAVDHGVSERGPGAGFGVEYKCFVDASGGRRDSFVACVAHSVGNQSVLDLIMEFPAPCSPKEVVASISQTLQAYGIDQVVGDNYGAELLVDLFSTHGVNYVATDKNRSEIYINFGVAIRSSRVVLLDHTRLVNQLIGLKRRTGSSGGRDTIDHPYGGADDVANAAAGALLLALLTNDQFGASEWLRAEASGGYRPPVPSTWFARFWARWNQIAQQQSAKAGARPAGPMTREMWTNNSQGRAHDAPLVKCPQLKPDGKVCNSTKVHLLPHGEMRCEDFGHQFWPGNPPPVYLSPNRRTFGG